MSDKDGGDFGEIFAAMSREAKKRSKEEEDVEYEEFGGVRSRFC